MVRTYLTRRFMEMLHPELANQGFNVYSLEPDQRSPIHARADEASRSNAIVIREFWNLPNDYPTIYETEDDCSRCDECVQYCEGCNGRFGYVEWNGDVSICATCAMPRCEECGERWETELQASNCCGPEGIYEWDFRPEFKFWRIHEGTVSYGYAPTDELFIGIELETECGIDSFPDFLSQADENYHAPNFCYGKRDGSLDETGVELVTMPATLDAFMQRFPWRALQAWNNEGARSFYRNSCGFHVHVSRDFFAPTHLWRFVAWQMRNQTFCHALAQRESVGYAKWRTLSEFGKYGSATLSDVVKGKADSGERYVAINFNNSETIELRYFRGNLRPEAIRARIEFVHALAYFTKNLSAREVMQGALSVETFSEYSLNRSDKYPTLATWIDNYNKGGSANVPSDTDN